MLPLLVVVFPQVVLGIYAHLLLATDIVDVTFDVWYGLSTASLWTTTLGLVMYCVADRKAVLSDIKILKYVTAQTCLLWLFGYLMQTLYISRGAYLYILHAATLYCVIAIAV
jgi:hypothetical protein